MFVHPSRQHREVAVTLTAGQWMKVTEALALEQEQETLSALIEAQVNEEIGRPLRAPSDDDDSGASKPKGGR